MSDMGPDKTDSDWRARPSADADDEPPKRDDGYGESESDQALLSVFGCFIYFIILTRPQGES